MPADRPRVGISACLLGERVRYDGGHKLAAGVVSALAPHVEWIAVCPEVEAGFGVPRPPMRLVRRDAAVLLEVIATGADVTARLDDAARTRVTALLAGGLHGYVLKARSPSCGIAGVPESDAAGVARPVGRGRFAAALLEACPDLPVADEESLADPVARAAFVARVRARAGA